MLWCAMSLGMSAPDLAEIRENLDVLEEWEERYAYLIQIGKALPSLPETLRTEETRVQGCASQVWLVSQKGEGADPILTFEGDSDALIVRGLVALTIAIHSGKKASEIKSTDAFAIFDELGLKAHLSSQRSNGLRSMLARIQKDAAAA
jgi:cysteine desulfuration protein SufE